MSKTAVPRSAVMIAFLAAATAAQAQTHDNDIPNLASAAFGWQHGFDGLNFQRVEGKVAPTGRGDRKSTRLNSSHRSLSRMPSSA